MENPDEHGLCEDEKENTGPERMAAYQHTVLALNTRKPCAGVFTYNTDEKSVYGQYFLLKILPYIDVNGNEYGPGEAKSVKTFDQPGKILSRYQCAETEVEIDFSTLLVGANPVTKSGGWKYTIQTAPACPVSLRIGGGKKSDMVGWKKVVNEEGKTVDLMTVMTRAVMVSEKFRENDATVSLQNDKAFLRASHPFVSGIRSDGILTSETSEEGTPYLSIKFPQGSGTVFGVFSRDEEETLCLIERELEADASCATEYYKELDAIRISTPEHTINETFRSAVYNMDYSYLAPYGWIEAIHHWMSIWHQQHCLAADWLGQQDRSRQVISSQAKALYPSGAAPMFYTSGDVFRAFGGTDHFYLWQVRHYLLQTDDKEFARWILPFCEKVLANSLTEYVPGGDLRWHWGEQIGNQEDYISHLHESASPSIEGINMLKTLALVSKLAEQPLKQVRYETLAVKARKALEHLWDERLGRFIYQIDATGKKHLEGQYQTYIYPYLYDFLDEEDAYTSFRHLRERLIGSEGELYCSNNFPNHMAATLGTQAGMAQQPWGAMAFAKMGQPDDAIKPLRYIAKFVADPDGCAGSWPEAADSIGSYFSPPAGVFIQTVVEYIYGLRIDRPDETITIAPSFPSDWPSASLCLPEYSVCYTKENSVISYSFESTYALAARMRWRLPPCQIFDFTVDEKNSHFTLSPCVNGIILECTIPRTKAFKVRFRCESVDIDLSYERVVEEGQTVLVRAKAAILEVSDRSGLLSEYSMRDGIRLSFKKEIITPYLKYGGLGLVNFSSRTIFLKLKTPQGIETIYPLDFTVVPALAVRSILTGNSLKVSLCRYTEKQFLNESCHSQDTDGLVVIDTEVLRPDLADPETGEWSYTLLDSINLLPGKTEAELIRGEQVTKFMIRNESVAIPEDIAGQIRAITLPESLLEKEDCWKNLKRMPFVSHMPWLNQKNPMEEFEAPYIVHPSLPCRFPITKGQFIPLSYRRGGSVTIPVGSEVRKFYVLLFSFLDNHDVFSPVLRINAELTNQRMVSKEYHYPGDLDGFWASNAVGCFSTAHSMEQRNDNPLSPPDPKTGLWPGMLPVSDFIYYFTKEYQNSFPSSLLWSDGYSIKLPNSVAGVVEFDLKRRQNIARLVLESVGTNTAFGILSICAI